MNMKLCINIGHAVLMLGGCATADVRPDPSAILREASQIARAAPEERDFADLYRAGDDVSTICRAQIAAGDLEGPWETAKAIKSNRWYRRDKEVVCLRIADAWAERGRSDRASAIRKEMGKEEKPDAIKARAVRLKARSGQMDEARKTAWTMQTESLRVRSVLDLAETCVRVGERAQARRLAGELVEGVDSFQDIWVKLMALEGAAEILASLGDSSGASQIFERASKELAELEEYQPLAKARLASSMARAGLFELALLAAGPLHGTEAEEEAAGEALENISIAQAKAGNLKDAMMTASHIVWSPYRERLLFELVPIYVRQKDFSGALVAAGGIRTLPTKARALLQIAAAEARTGNREGARAIANSVDLVDRHPILWWRKTGPPFSLSSPRTWVRGCRDWERGTGMHYEYAAIMDAGDVAAAAMELDQALGGRDPLRYAEAFAGFHPEIVRRIARSQAAVGNP